MIESYSCPQMIIYDSEGYSLCIINNEVELLRACLWIKNAKAEGCTMEDVDTGEEWEISPKGRIKGFDKYDEATKLLRELMEF